MGVFCGKQQALFTIWVSYEKQYPGSCCTLLTFVMEGGIVPGEETEEMCDQTLKCGKPFKCKNSTVCVHRGDVCGT